MSTPEDHNADDSPETVNPSPAGVMPARVLRVVPRRRTRQQLSEAPAKLATTLISVATAGMLDAGRFRRGREYATSGAVTELVVRPGSVRGTVQGGRREPYVVDVHTEPGPAPAGGRVSAQQLAALAPAADELAARCTCPDADDGIVCKHAAAVLISLAEEIGDRPELLVVWRHGDAPSRARATIGSRLGSGAARTPAPSTPAPSPFASPAWQEFFAAPGPIPTGRPDGLGPERSEADRHGTDHVGADRLGAERLGQLDLGELVRGARAALRRATRP